MLPPVINEQEISPFKFWFEDSIQDGMYYRSELYYRRHIGDVRHRAQIYHYACKLAYCISTVVTLTKHQCSIWVSLRGERPGELAKDPLLSFVEPFPITQRPKPASEDE
ncbi:MAG: hypothetical protein AAFY26_21730 [Cyanobacteria bacterium J06638_22]